MSAFLDRKEKDRYAQTDRLTPPEENPEDESAAEEWLISPRIASRRKERQELFAASAAALRRSSYENYESPVNRCLEARSSVSSPGTTGMRDRIQRDLLKEEFHRRMQRSGVLLEVETNFNNPTKNCQKQSNGRPAKDKSSVNASEKRPMQRSSSDRLVERPPPMRRFSSTTEVVDHRSKDEPETRQKAKPQTSPTAQSRRKKSSSSSQPTGDDAVLLRLSRQVRLGRRGELPHLLQRRTNRIILHVYDLIAEETVVLLPFGYDFPIGKFFNVLNSGLHSLGTGAYHVGVEVCSPEEAVFSINSLIDNNDWGLPFVLWFR